MSRDDNPQMCADESALALMHSAVLSSISLFDQKCSMLLTIDSGALVFCVGTVAGLVPGASADFHPDKLGGVLLLATAALLSISAIFALLVVWPRTSRSSKDPLFWNTWPRADKTENYILPIQRLSFDEAVLAKSRHLGLLGDICRLKMSRLRAAVVFALLGLLVLLFIAGAHFFPGGRPLLAMSLNQFMQWPQFHIHALWWWSYPR